MCDVFLVRLRGDQGLIEPEPIIDMLDLVELEKLDNAFPHDRRFSGIILDLLHNNGLMGASINDTLIALESISKRLLLKTY